MKPKDPKRGDDQSTLTISLPKSLKARIVLAAEGETRSVSNWCVYQLERLLNQATERKEDSVRPAVNSDQAKSSRAG